MAGGEPESDRPIVFGLNPTDGYARLDLPGVMGAFDQGDTTAVQREIVDLTERRREATSHLTAAG